jgi:AcrR family transcriptional regulator
MRISELEERSGVPRRTIYYYIGQGLLPGPQKNGARNASFGEEHLRRLDQIRSLRRQGQPLNRIRQVLSPQDEATGEGSQERLEAETRRRILQTAARLFGTRGYRNTHVRDIIAELEIAPGTLYRFFPTKRQLFLQVVEDVTTISVEYVEPEVAHDPDPLSRNVRRTAGLLGQRAESPDILTFMRAEALGEDDAVRELVEAIYWQLMKPIAEDLVAARKSRPRLPDLDPELLAYALGGAGESVLMRMSWDDRYSLRDYFSVLLALYVAVDSLLEEAPSLVDKFNRYRPLLEELVETGPLGPAV